MPQKITYKMQHSCNHVGTIRHPNSSYVTTKLVGTSTIIRSYKKELFSRLLPSTYSGNVGLAAAASLDDSCQSGKMATLFNNSCSKFRFCRSTVSNIIIIIILL